jgi:3'(2'), 5'-bisphosphate nucleotidase
MDLPLDSDLAGTRRTAEILTTIAIRAAAAILRLDCRNVSMRQKADESPVTLADEAAQSVILRDLTEGFPRVPIVSEEADRPDAPGDTFFLVDPLDGTREFLAGRDEYTVNIALVRDGVPVIGVVGAPALGLIWRGGAGHAERISVADGMPSGRSTIKTRRWPAERVAAVSRSHYEAASAEFLQRFAPITELTCGSALKFCRVAEGAADLYPRLAPTSEWDVAAGHAVVVAAGGLVTAPDGTKLTYGRAGFRVPGFVAWGDPGATCEPGSGSTPTVRP